MQPLLYLASLSPRRSELLKQLGLTHQVLKVDVDERRRPSEAVQDYVLRLALAKARAGRKRLFGEPETPVLAADTAVAVDNEILGKPADRIDALRMMALLSGRTHRVYTGVALINEREQARLSVSQVEFRNVESAEARAYWNTGEPEDKAGGYAIQGLGAIFVTRLSGSFSGVMGLPLFETAQLLQSCGIQVLERDPVGTI